MAKVFKPCAVNNCNRDANAKGGKSGYCRPHHDRLKMYGDPLGGRAPNGDALRWLKSKVSVRCCSCLLWPFAKQPSGYGVVGQEYAHRLMCELVNGPAPSIRHYATHSCGNGGGGCVSPAHLRWGTPADNAADMIGHGTAIRGEKARGAKLSERSVLEMKSLKGKMLQKDIAVKFGVDPTTVSNVFTGKNWAWLE